MPIAMPRFGSRETPEPVPTVALARDLVIRPARVDDVHAMSALINHYAGANVMLARGPQYLYQHIQDYIVITAPAAGGGGEVVVACGALHVLWEDLAEIRSVAVHESCRAHGLGSEVVGALVKRSEMLGIPRVFVFTLAPAFFGKCGFGECNRDELPPMVWVECSKCPKFYRCDEIAMILATKAANASPRGNNSNPAP